MDGQDKEIEYPLEQIRPINPEPLKVEGNREIIPPITPEIPSSPKPEIFHPVQQPSESPPRSPQELVLELSTNSLTHPQAPESIKQTRVDSIISKIIEKSPRIFKLNILRLFGSGTMKASYLDPILQKQVARGRLTQEEMTEYHRLILGGKADPLIWDLGISMLTSQVAPKIGEPILASWLVLAGHPEFALLSLPYMMTANPLAVPYFTGRALQEIWHSANELRTSADIKAWNRFFEFTKRSIITLSLVPANLIPIAAWIVPAPLMSQFQNKGLSKVLLVSIADNLGESAHNLKNRFKKTSNQQ